MDHNSLCPKAAFSLKMEDLNRVPKVDSFLLSFEDHKDVIQSVKINSECLYSILDSWKGAVFNRR